MASYCQTPTAFNYQAIIRNSDGTPKANETVALQINIVNEQGVSSYIEIHNIVSTEHGYVNVIVGRGVSSDNLSSVDWASGPYFIDITVNGVAMGSSPLLSVPYALHAISADSMTSAPTETDPLFEASVASEITVPDVTNWNQKISSYTETQSLADVLVINNAANGQIKDLSNPTDAQDAVNKAYVDSLYAVTEANLDSLKMILYQILDINDLLAAGASISDLLNAGKSLEDLINAGADILALYNLGFMVGTLEQNGADSTDLANAGLTGTVADIDGNFYKTVKIGEQIWMAENLSVTRFNNNTDIPIIEDSIAWEALSTAAYCWPENDKEKYGDSYGALYNGYTIEEGNLCPSNWHVPSDEDWFKLEIFLGIPQAELQILSFRGTNEGGELKESGFEHWDEPNEGATNSSNFSALAAGYRYDDGTFRAVGEATAYWATSTYVGVMLHRRLLHTDHSQISRSAYYKNGAFSVRCVKND